jgi:UDP-N-acetylglucosamine 1-carboxyvinyltransferase
MDYFVIEGETKLEGRVEVRTAKNALLPCMAAALLTPEPVVFKAHAQLQDIAYMAGILRHLGATVEDEPGRPMVITAEEIPSPECPYDLVRKMRASAVTLGPLLARFGRARVALPGGCAIGARPLDQHLKGLGALGADIRIEHGYIEAEASKLRGAEVVFDMPTVGGTQNVLMAAVMAEGKTTIRNAALEPEIADLASLLIKMGASIEGLDTGTLVVEGVPGLHGAEHACIPDRVEAGTFLIAAAITSGDVTVESANAGHLDALLVKLREMGAAIELVNGSIRLRATGELRAVDITTAPHPGFPTDLQAQFMALLTQARGAGVVKETVFENRFMHVPELMRMGADIRIDGNVSVVNGPTPLNGAETMASDLRASACLVLAALCAKGRSEVRRIYHLDRGYERLEERLNALGARISRVQT